MEDQNQKQKSSSSLFTKVSEYISAHPKIILVIIIVLIVLILYLTVFYRGLFGLGPYKESFSQSKIDELVDQINNL